MSPLEFWLFLPQMRLTMDQLVERARAAEAAGFAGIAGMDHLTPPMAESQPMFEAMITNTWLASQTEELRIGSLVLCDSFRHPAVLAKRSPSTMPREGGSSWASAGARWPRSSAPLASGRRSRRSG